MLTLSPKQLTPPSPTQPPSPTPPAAPPVGPAWPSWGLLLLVLAGMLLWRTTNLQTTTPATPYSQVHQWVTEKQIESVTVTGQLVKGKLKAPQTVADSSVTEFHTLLPPTDEDTIRTLRDQGVSIRVESEQEPVWTQMLWLLLPMALLIGPWIWLSRKASRLMGQGGPMSGMLRGGKTHKFDVKATVNVTFDDVAGLKSAKQDLQEIVQFLKEPERFRKLGGKVPRGVLLVGPPGTGKTLLARAVAGESGVAFFSISASEFIEMFVGVGAARVRELFAEAKKAAPAIVFIDEIDAVGRSRGAGMGGGHDEREQTLNQLLSEMDGFERNDLTIVLAATNRPDVLDPALLRPGRFDRRVVVDRPESRARLAILEVHTRTKPLGADVELETIAQNTPGFSGADLANLVNEAAIHATRRGGESIDSRDFTAAYEKIVLGDPREAKLDAAEKHRVAVHEAGHAIVAHLSPEAERLHRISIIPRGMALGVTQQTPGGDRHIMTQSQLQTKLRVLMGGYAAEQVVFGDISTGAESDLKQATELASKMVSSFGMSERLGPVYYEHGVEHPFLGRRLATEGGVSDATTHAIESETRDILVTALGRARDELNAHRALMNQLVGALLIRETLEQPELVALLGPAASEALRETTPVTGENAA